MINLREKRCTFPEIPLSDNLPGNTKSDVQCSKKFQTEKVRGRKLPSIKRKMTVVLSEKRRGRCLWFNKQQPLLTFLFRADFRRLFQWKINFCSIKRHPGEAYLLLRSVLSVCPSRLCSEEKNKFSSVNSQTYSTVENPEGIQRYTVEERSISNSKRVLAAKSSC